jgi:hypothetical protein
MLTNQSFRAKRVAERRPESAVLSFHHLKPIAAVRARIKASSRGISSLTRIPGASVILCSDGMDDYSTRKARVQRWDIVLVVLVNPSLSELEAFGHPLRKVGSEQWHK